MKDFKLECARLELELEDEKAAKEKLEAENEELKDKVIDLKDRISDLEVEISEMDKKDDEIADLEHDIEEWETRVEELEADLEKANNLNKFKICGETVGIKTDNLAHQTYFEKFAEKSRHYSINELTDKLKHL